MRPFALLRSVGLLLVLGLASGCSGGGGGGGSSVDANAPVIANLRVAFGPRCTLSGGAAGTVETLTLDYADADGNLNGGTLLNTTTGAAGNTVTFTGPIPSSGITISGTTSGVITIPACLHFGANPSVTELVQVTDASGKVSNTLTLQVARPDGAPLSPQGADPTLRKSH